MINICLRYCLRIIKIFKNTIFEFPTHFTRTSVEYACTSLYPRAFAFKTSFVTLYNFIYKELSIQIIGLYIKNT